MHYYFEGVILYGKTNNLQYCVAKATILEFPHMVNANQTKKKVARALSFKDCCTILNVFFFI